MASEIWSATLSGWPSDTDSKVNRYELRMEASPVESGYKESFICRLSGARRPSTMPPKISRKPSTIGITLPKRAKGVGELAAGGRTASITPAVRHGSAS